MLDYITLRNFGTVRPIFTKIASKVAQDSKEKSRESPVRGKKILRNYRAKRRGGGGFHPPPPGLIRVKPFIHNVLQSPFMQDDTIPKFATTATRQYIIPHCLLISSFFVSLMHT